MTTINKNERDTIKQRLLAVGSANLALIYSQATYEPADWVTTQPVAVVVTHLLGRLAEDTAIAITVCNELVNLTPNHPSTPLLRAVVDRLQRQKAQAAHDPIQELWIGSEPVVNRSALRSLLQDIVLGHYHGVIYVAGGRNSGRSHSFQLIRHVARDWNVPYHRVDFALTTELRNLQHLFRGLRDAYAIDVAEPIYEGTTPGDVAKKCADRLRQRLVELDLHPKPWLIIDYTDEVPDPAVPEFIRLFCADRDANLFDNCVIFVLGPTAHLNSMRGDFGSLQVEDLSQVTQFDILDAVAALNQRGSKQLDDLALRNRAQEIYASILQLPDDEQLPRLRRALLELRREVRAP